MFAAVVIVMLQGGPIHLSVSFLVITFAVSAADVTLCNVSRCYCSTAGHETESKDSLGHGGVELGQR